MKRYRILAFDFDSRSHFLEPVQDHWEERVKDQHIANTKNVIDGLASQYGAHDLERKVNDFYDLKSKPFSISAFHNKFLEQIRSAFVSGGYYAALTGACALGERILNHMILMLRDYHKSSDLYKKVYRKDSFDYWPLPIEALESWGELLPDAAEKFRSLNGKRNHAIHFNPEVDQDDRELALDAIHLLQDIVSVQFSPFGAQPWTFSFMGEIYIKKDWENQPLIKHLFIPNSALVGPRHKLDSIIPKVVVNDSHEYEDRNVSDQEYIELRKQR